MDKVKLDKPDSSRTTEGLQHRFRLAYQRLAISRKARVFGEKPSKEYVTAALWLFFSEMDEGEAEAFLAEWFPRLEAVLREEAATRGEAVGRGGAPASGDQAAGPMLPSAAIEEPRTPRGRRRKRAE